MLKDLTDYAKIMTENLSKHYTHCARYKPEMVKLCQNYVIIVNIPDLCQIRL